jgi:hypothetical protein
MESKDKVQVKPWFLDFDCSLCREVLKLDHRLCYRCIHNPFATYKYKKDYYVKISEA